MAGGELAVAGSATQIVVRASNYQLPFWHGFWYTL
jgi:hypothetical protein